MKKKRDRKEYNKKYREENKDRERERSKKYREENREKIKKKREESKEERKIYLIKNKEKIKLQQREYYLNNKEEMKYRSRKNRQNEDKNKAKSRAKKWRLRNKKRLSDRRSNYRKKRIENDPSFRLRGSIRSLISISLKNGFTIKSKKTIEILGCSFDEFKIFIENKFDEKMNWENYGEYWQLDHIKPISWAVNEKELYEFNHYSNFQPLYWLDNIIKGNRFEG